MASCPNCGKEVDVLIPVDSGMKLRLKSNSSLDSVPDQICPDCRDELNSNLSKGAILRKEAQAKEQNRLMLWRSRVALVKQAKEHMKANRLSDAAVAYEKYIRILEIVYEKEAGALTPQLFNNEARKNELTVIASVYWDLMRIYDSGNSFQERLQKASEKLAEFARFTPIYPAIIRRAESYMRSANNPKAFKRFLGQAQKLRPRCFIATTVFTVDHPVVLDLVEFRDSVLEKSFLGRMFVGFYYVVSPRIIPLIELSPRLKSIVRRVLLHISLRLKKGGGAS